MYQASSLLKNSGLFGRVGNHKSWLVHGEACTGAKRLVRGQIRIEDQKKFMVSIVVIQS